jgi:FlaG/FlaF family flagellin (archaellin)
VSCRRQVLAIGTRANDCSDDEPSEKNGSCSDNGRLTRPVSGCLASERSVSPVIGVTLLVAILVILAAMTAMFAFGLAKKSPPAPQTKFTYDYEGSSVTIRITAGDTISSGNTGRLIVLIDGSDSRKTWASTSGAGIDLQTENLTAGDTITLDNVELDQGDTVSVVWHAPTEDKTVTIAKDTGPSLTGGGFLDTSGSVVTASGGAVSGDGGATSAVKVGGAQALGSIGDIDSDGFGELPYVDGSGDLQVNDSNGEVETLVPSSASEAPDTDKTLMATGSWDGSPDSVFYVGDGHSKIYRVAPGGSPTLVQDVGGVNSVLGIGDIDGDGSDELVYAGSSQEVRYLETDGTKKTTGFTSGSSSGIGNGPLWDWDGDGKEEAVIVDGSNDVRLVDSSGSDGAKPAQSSVSAAKSPVTATDVDSDGALEIVFTDDSSTDLEYIDDVDGSPTVKILTDTNGNIVPGDKDTGVVS